VRGGGAAWRGTLTDGPGSTVTAASVFKLIQMIQKWFKRIQICSNFGRLKRYLSMLQKLEIKYVVKRLRWGTALSKEIHLDSKGIWN
jgi:hypothetical protein